MIVFERICCAGLVLPMLSISLGACTLTPSTLPPSELGEREWVLAGASEIPADMRASIDPARLLAVNDEMRDFVRRVTADARTRTDKINALSHALLDSDGMGLHYDSEATLTAAQAFSQRRANCLSYTLLIVALLRDIGISARFNYVQIPPVWDLRGDQLLLYQHVNARVDEPPPRNVNAWRTTVRALVLDVTSADYSPNYPQWVIEDDEALAQFYNNLAIDSVRTNPLQALRDQLEALRLAPKQAFLWSNLAQRYLSLGNLKAAEAAVRTSLQLDPENLLAYAVAARVYRRLGDQTRVHQLQKQEQALLDHNPYFHYWLAQRAFKLSQLSAASEAVQQAIALNPADPRFYFLQGVILHQQDKLREAQRSLETALRLSAGDDEQQARYRSKFARLNLSLAMPASPSPQHMRLSGTSSASEPETR